MTITEFRKHTAKAADQVEQDYTPMLLTRGNKKPLVIMSLDQFSSYEETAYLMSTEANRKALKEAIADVKANRNLTTFNTLEDAIAFAETEAEKKKTDS